MSTRSCCSLLVLCLMSSGCTQNPHLDAYLEAVRAEKLWLEDQFYDLEYKYESQEAELQAARDQNRQFRQALGMEIDPPGDHRQAQRFDEEPGDVYYDGSYYDEATEEEPYADEFAYDDTYYEDDLDAGPAADDRAFPPEVPNQLRAENSVLVDSHTASYETTGDEPAEYDDGVEFDGREPEPHHDPDHVHNSLRDGPESTDPRVTHIVLNPSLTRGHDFDHRVGDDGISIVFQPRNADDRFVAASGAVSIVVLDPAIQGEQARLARWDFDEEEIRYRLKTRSLSSRGIHLKLPWPDQPPAHSKLHVFVRFTTEDDRLLEADREVFVSLPGQFSGRWTPKSLRTANPRSITAFQSNQSGDRSVLQKSDRPSIANERNRTPNAVVPASATSQSDSAPVASQSGEDGNSVPRSSPIRRPVWSPDR